MSTVLVLLVVVLAGWAVAFALRPPRPAPHAQQLWEHWLEASGLRPVIPRMAPVVEAATAAGRDPRTVDRAALGKARDGVPLVVAQFADGDVVVAARRSGPVPSDAGVAVASGWQLTVSTRPVGRAFEDAAWIRTGPALRH